MKLTIQQLSPDTQVSPLGIGPIVSLFMGPQSAPAALYDAPTTTALQTGDQVAIVRNGMLYTMMCALFTAGISSAAVTAAIGAVSTQLASFTDSIATLTTQTGQYINANTLAGYDPTGIVADSSGPMMTALNSMSALGGGTLVLNPTDRPFVGPGGLVIPANTTLNMGVASAGLSGNGVYGLNAANTFSLGPGPGGCILLHPAGTITLSTNAAIQNGYIVNSTLTTPTSTANALAQIAGFSGTCITPNGSHCDVQNVVAIGFNQFVNATDKQGRLRVFNCDIDCTNGVNITTSGDLDRVTGLRQNAWFISGISNLFPDGHPISLTVRNGIFISAGSPTTTTTDALQILDCFTFGHAIVGSFDNLYRGSWIGGGGECPYSGGWGPTGLNLSTVIGIQTSGTTDMSIMGVELSNHQYNLLINSTGLVTEIGSKLSADGGVIQHVQLGAGSNFSSLGLALNAGPTPCVNVQAGCLGAQFIGYKSTTVFNIFTVDDSVIPYFTATGVVPGGYSANAPWNGVIAGQCWQYFMGSGGTTCTQEPLQNNENAGVFVAVNIGSATNPLSQLYANNQIATRVLNKSCNPAVVLGSGHLTYATGAGLGSSKNYITSAVANAYGVFSSFAPPTVVSSTGTTIDLCNEHNVANCTAVAVNVCVPSGCTILNLPNSGSTPAIGVILPAGMSCVFTQISATLWAFDSGPSFTPIYS